MDRSCSRVSARHAALAKTKAQSFWFRQSQTQSETGIIAANRVGLGALRVAAKAK
jgi:hypothetical protein